MLKWGGNFSLFFMFWIFVNCYLGAQIGAEFHPITQQPQRFSFPFYGWCIFPQERIPQPHASVRAWGRPKLEDLENKIKINLTWFSQEQSHKRPTDKNSAEDTTSRQYEVQRNLKLGQITNFLFIISHFHLNISYSTIFFSGYKHKAMVFGYRG